MRDRRLRAWEAEFARFESNGRAHTDLETIGKAATFGQVAKLLVDAESLGYGTIDENGKIAKVEKRVPVATT